MIQNKKTGFWNTLKFEDGMGGVFSGTAKEEALCRKAVSAGYAWAMKKPENREAVIGLVQVRDVRNVPELLEVVQRATGNPFETSEALHALECILKHICLAVRLGAEQYIRTSKESNRQQKQAIGKAVESLTAKNADEHREDIWPDDDNHRLGPNGERMIAVSSPDMCNGCFGITRGTHTIIEHEAFCGDEKKPCSANFRKDGRYIRWVLAEEHRE